MAMHLVIVNCCRNVFEVARVFVCTGVPGDMSNQQ